jgi:hypothetical protein
MPTMGETTTKATVSSLDSYFKVSLEWKQGFGVKWGGIENDCGIVEKWNLTRAKRQSF